MYKEITKKESLAQKAVVFLFWLCVVGTILSLTRLYGCENTTINGVDQCIAFL